MGGGMEACPTKSFGRGSLDSADLARDDNYVRLLHPTGARNDTFIKN